MSFLEKIKEKLPFEIGGAGLAKSTEAGEPKKIDLLAKPEPPKRNLVGSLLNKLNIKKEKKPEDTYSPLITSALQTEKSPTDERILEAPPEIDESLLEDVEPPKSILLYILKGAFAFLVVLGIGAVLFFTIQTSRVLDFATNSLNIPSVLDQLNVKNEEIKSIQTELNLYRFLQGKFYFNQISYYGDEYARNYYIKWNSTIPDEERKAAGEEMTKLKGKIVKAFNLAAEKLTKKKSLVLVDLDVEDDSQYETIFTDLLIQKLGEESSPLYNQTRQLVANNDLYNLLQTTDIGGLNEHELNKLINDVNSIVENELSAIQKIKESRLNWSDIMNQIELETSYVDQYFSEGYFEALGGIQYTSYDFDASTGEMTITGVTKRYDTTNFTMITNLIDQLNASPYFTGVEMNSFTKSGSASEGYTSTLSLKVQLQKEAFEELDKQIIPEAVPEFLNKETGISVSGIKK